AETLALSDVVSIAAIGRKFWAKLDGSIDAGFSYTRSSGIAQTNLNGSVMFRKPAFLVRLMASGTLTKEEGKAQDDRGATDLAYIRYRGRAFFSGATRFETNKSLGLELRSQVGGSGGWRAVNSSRAQLQVGAGIVGNDERGVDADATQNIE